MATLMQIRAALEDGQARGLKQLSRQVDAPPALVEAILERLIALGKVERVAAQSSGGCGGGCKGSNHIHTYQLVRKNTFPHQKIQTGLSDQQNQGVRFLMRKLFLTDAP